MYNFSNNINLVFDTYSLIFLLTIVLLGILALTLWVYALIDIIKNPKTKSQPQDFSGLFLSYFPTFLVLLLT